MLKKLLKVLLSIILILMLGIVGYSAKVYFDVKNTAKDMHETIDRPKSEKREKAVNIDGGEPFSVLLLGLDTGDLGRDEQGRSDSMMIATVSPKTNKTTITSLPRDTRAEIVGHGTTDKINHAYAFGGVPMSMDTVENLLDIPVDHYVSINMKGLKELVDAVGGIDVNNTLDFSQDGTHFPVGNVHLTGETALSFSRMRYEDPNGDYGRQGRQRQIIEGVIKKALSIKSVTNYKNILDALADNMKTDLNWDDMMDIQSKYRSAFGVIEEGNLQGDGQMIDGVSYQIVSDGELDRVQTMLKEQLAE
ncbi:LCP family glycopolymer transferase [Vagococcus fessus]|uniref:Polyisoprenyl-teichoic acid--peptidoglycan teichoic acid transferase TagU n=1 Tax=Vagococcus fessus TaxID=120370 RepID=A0A430A816_9ENTE|nr:LCP family protein [Vagococcus fessus]RSU03260.1 transcriptional regulator [Vagococcus fessus]